MSWLWGLLAKLLGSLVDKWVAFTATREAGRTEANLDAIRKAEAEEAEAQRAAEEAEKLPPMTNDGWRRD